MSVELPCRLGPFLLLRHLASGGMGAVYLAHQSHDGEPRLCVVKTVRSDLANDPVAVRRFVDEARTSALLMHPNVVQVYDVGEDNGTAYIAVEYVPGRDLMAVFLAARRTGRPLPEALALHITAELLDALDYAHHAQDPRTGAALQVVHRDVSPQNVLVGFSGEVKLIDFGIARSAVRHDLTHVGQMVGKIRYVSPEQARGEAVDAATDVWAACVTACEILTGERFWGGRGAEAVAPLLAAGEPVDPPGFDTLTPDVQAALRPGLDVVAERRPGAAFLRDRLRALVDKRGLAQPRQQLAAMLEELFGGERELEQRARTALLQDPTVVRAAALPDSAIFRESSGDGRDGGGGRAAAQDTISMRPAPMPDTQVFEPTPLSASAPTPSVRRASRRRRPRSLPAWLAPGAVAAACAATAGAWLAMRPVATVSPPATVLRPPPLVVPVVPPPQQEQLVEPTAAPAAPAERPAPAPLEVAAPALAPADAVATKPARKPGKAKKPEAKPRLFGDRVRALRECDPRPLCAASVLRRADDVLSLSVEELRDLDQALERCLARCR